MIDETRGPCYRCRKPFDAEDERRARYGETGDYNISTNDHDTLRHRTGRDHAFGAVELCAKCKEKLGRFMVGRFDPELVGD